jgi:2-dehydropantoate 2-reductase
MRFLVVGAGAVGGYVGARLAADGNEVVFMERRRVREVLESRGLRIESASSLLTLDTPNTFVGHESAGFFDVVLVCVRAGDTESIIETVRPVLSFDCAVISLQSGVDPMCRLMEAFGERHVLPGYARVAVDSHAPAVVQELDSAPGLAVGEFDGGGSWRLECLQAAFEAAGFALLQGADMVAEQWRNFLLEAALASTAAKTDLGIRTQLKTAEYRSDIRELLVEGIAIASAEGVALGDSPGVLLASAESSPEALWLHMRRDLGAGRPIENRALAGSLSRRAAKMGIAAPAWTRLYEALESRAPSPGPGRDMPIPPARAR